MGAISETYGALKPEDIDPSICTHLVYLYGAVNEETEEIEIKTINPMWTTGDEALIPRLRRLKEVNPDLKLILQIAFPPLNWEEIADFFCDMKSEFVKYGYILATSLMDNLLPGPSQQQRDSFSKMARCCDHITLEISQDHSKVYRLAGLNITKSNVDRFIERGLPANKTQITVTVVGTVFTTVYPNETRLGDILAPGDDNFAFFGGISIQHKQILRKLNESSLGWTLRCEEDTKEPYAFTRTGLWTSYEDRTSMEFNARYVLDKGLGGIDIIAMELEDDEGIEGHGRFPLTRAIYNKFRRGNQSADTTA
ncbi:hypothetical protein J437_LFUL014769 [Ladona fulva]|uniref:GH18 domain-containing protein n=1 Tax=Ladona fulva TaxID=123851 RepID=A0A8K0KFY1_LADFU|nr:hypothetical protein J437_LFUL014769 [Ladona fulva]